MDMQGMRSGHSYTFGCHFTVFCAQKMYNIKQKEIGLNHVATRTPGVLYGLG